MSGSLRPASRRRGRGPDPARAAPGTDGRSALVDRLVREGKLDAGELRGQWESFLIATVADPLPGVRVGLAVVGSDRRGTAFGVYELSQGIGVSPGWAPTVPNNRWADPADARAPDNILF